MAHEAAHPRTRPPGFYCGTIVSLEGCRQGFPREVAAGEFSPRNESAGGAHYNISIGEKRQSGLISVVTLPVTSIEVPPPFPSTQ